MNSLTNAIFGKRVLHIIFADDYIDWAGEMLVEGYDSPHLRILAGLERRSNIFEVEMYFLRSIKELNIEEIEPKAAIRAYACDVSQQIIDGKFTSVQQAMRALYQVWLYTAYDPDYAILYAIWSELDDALDHLHAGGSSYSYPSATLENFDAIVRQETARFIARMAS